MKPKESDIDKLKEARLTHDATLRRLDTEIFGRLAGVNRLLAIYYPVFAKSHENHQELDRRGLGMPRPEILEKLMLLDPAAPPPLSFTAVMVKAADMLTHSGPGPWPFGYQLPELLDEEAGDKAWAELGDHQTSERLHNLDPDTEVIQ